MVAAARAAGRHPLTVPPARAAPVGLAQGILLYIGATDVLPLALPHHAHHLHTSHSQGHSHGHVHVADKVDSSGDAEEGGKALEMAEAKDAGGRDDGHDHGSEARRQEARNVAEACEGAAPDDVSPLRLLLRVLLLGAGMGVVALSTLWHVHCEY